MLFLCCIKKFAWSICLNKGYLKNYVHSAMLSVKLWQYAKYFSVISDAKPPEKLIQKPQHQWEFFSNKGFISIVYLARFLFQNLSFFDTSWLDLIFVFYRCCKTAEIFQQKHIEKFKSEVWVACLVKTVENVVLLFFKMLNEWGLERMRTDVNILNIL